MFVCEHLPRKHSESVADPTVEAGICHAFPIYPCLMSAKSGPGWGMPAGKANYATFLVESAGSLKRIMKRIATTRAYAANTYHAALQFGSAAL